MATAPPEKWKYAAAVPLSLVCLAAGNLLAVILISVWGWQAIQPGEPGSVLLGFIQGYIGSLIAMVASDHVLKSAAPGDFSLKWIVRIVAIVTALIFVWALAAGHDDLVFAWTPLAAVTAIVGTEFGRRVYDHI